MKKFLLLLIVPLFHLSCSNDSESEDVTLELLPVSEVEIPGNINAGKDNMIKVRYVRPTDCYSFNKFYFEMSNTTRTIAVETKVAKNNGNSTCRPITNNSLSTEVLKFHPETTGNYKLKFWKGKDTNGNDMFLTYDVTAQ